jgi:hypothetical protein
MHSQEKGRGKTCIYHDPSRPTLAVVTEPPSAIVTISNHGFEGFPDKDISTMVLCYSLEKGCL